MLGKPRILSLFPNSFNKFNKHEHSCKILYIMSKFCVSDSILWVIQGIIRLFTYCKGRQILIFISRRGSAISSAKPGKSGSIHYLVKNK